MRRMDKSDGSNIPHEFVRGRFMYCAGDNINFVEDAPDGKKKTLHGTVIVCFQDYSAEDQSEMTLVSKSAASV